MSVLLGLAYVMRFKEMKCVYDWNELLSIGRDCCVRECLVGKVVAVDSLNYP